MKVPINTKKSLFGQTFDLISSAFLQSRLIENLFRGNNICAFQDMGKPLYVLKCLNFLD